MNKTSTVRLPFVTDAEISKAVSVMVEFRFQGYTVKSTVEGSEIVITF